MRIVKYIAILAGIVVIAYCGGWFYLANKITSEVNNQFGGKKHLVKLTKDHQYEVTFNKATSSGFPFGFAVSIDGWQEESAEALLTYKSPIIFGYNLATQNLYVKYDGEIDASYKPLASGFGALLKVSDYAVQVGLSLTKEFLGKVHQFQDPAEIINYIGKLNVASGKVEVFDKQSNELVYNKDLERLSVSFTPALYYKNIEELLNDIPKEYNVEYEVVARQVKAQLKKIPASLFYGFVFLPGTFSINTNMGFKTKAKSFKDFTKDIEVSGEFNASINDVEFNAFNFAFKGGINSPENQNVNVLTAGQIRVKAGFFDNLIKNYQHGVRSKLLSLPAGQVVDQELSYIIANKAAFRFKDLENRNYSLRIDLNSQAKGKTSNLLQINDFSIYSGDAGFKLTHQSKASSGGSREWDAHGTLLVKNYPSVVDFTSGYIYRFGKFKFLNEQARSIYVEVNKSFLRSISNQPASESKDLSLDYKLESRNLPQSTIGTAKIANIPQMYMLMLYKTLLGTIDTKGDILGQIKNILPDFNEKDPALQKILPQILGKDIKKILPEQAQEEISKKLKEAVPESARDVIKEVMSLKKLKKNLDNEQSK